MSRRHSWRTDYHLYRMSLALGDLFTAKPSGKTPDRKNEENNSDESSDKRSQWIAVIVIWLFAFVVIAIRFSL